MAYSARVQPVVQDVLSQFLMPKAVPITGRTSSITNSFINSIIPVVVPTVNEVSKALSILEMTDGVHCAYCGDPHTEWDHLRPLVLGKQPTGYISEIHNLVPACGKCNQSKGNKDWREWMFGPAKRSPATRGVAGLEIRPERLSAFEARAEPTRLEFAALAGPELWSAHWDHHARIVTLMKEAQLIAAEIRESVKRQYVASSPTR